MRTLRLSLAGLLILAMLGGSGAAAAAQEDPAALEAPHPVTGQSWEDTFTRGTPGFDAERGVMEHYGYRYSDRVEMDDPRLSGTMWHVWNSDVISSGKVAAGTVELVSDGGSWVGTAREYSKAHIDHTLYHVLIELTGTGDHAGYSALPYWRGDPEIAPWDIDGFVFPGVLPPYPDPVEVPVE